jgi:class 3 adenylate cyclase
MAGGRIRVLLADDSVIVREGVIDRGDETGLPCFELGTGLCTGSVAAALLGSEERYTLVGDTVNLAQRLQDLARPAGRIVMSESTYRALREPIEAEPLDSLAVKGRETPVHAYRITITETTEEGTGE